MLKKLVVRKENTNILEDIFEAYIGAIYLDHGYDMAENLLLM